MTTGKFKGKYTIADGYAGGDRPQSFTFYAMDLEPDMTDADLLSAYEDAAHAHFEQHITPEVASEEEFIKWARVQLKLHRVIG